VALAALWTSVVVAVLGVGASTRIGPTVVEITPTHGVHLGDVVFGLLAAAVASLVTLAVARSG
jgi:hypothetical protein